MVNPVSGRRNEDPAAEPAPIPANARMYEQLIEIIHPEKHQEGRTGCGHNCRRPCQYQRFNRMLDRVVSMGDEWVQACRRMVHAVQEPEWPDVKQAMVPIFEETENQIIDCEIQNGTVGIDLQVQSGQLGNAALHALPDEKRATQRKQHDERRHGAGRIGDEESDIGGLRSIGLQQHPAQGGFDPANGDPLNREDQDSHSRGEQDPMRVVPNCIRIPQ